MRHAAPAALVASAVIDPGSARDGGVLAATSTTKVIAVEPVSPFAPMRA